MSQAFVSLNRLRVIVLFILFAFFVLCGRLFYLHVVDSERLKSYAEDVRRDMVSSGVCKPVKAFAITKVGDRFLIDGVPTSEEWISE